MEPFEPIQTCPSCDCPDVDFVEVPLIDGTGMGFALECLDCGMRSPIKASMMEASKSWNMLTLSVSALLEKKLR